MPDPTPDVRAGDGLTKLWGCRLVPTGVLAVLVFVAAAPTTAEKAPFHGFLIQEISNTEIMIDIGQEHGLAVGQEVEVYQSIKMPHPVTGEIIEDHILLGTELVARVGQRVAVLGPLVNSTERLKIGDPVRVPGLATAVPLTPTECHCPECAPDPESEAVHAQWVLNLGEPLDQRGKAWLEFLTLHPNTLYRHSIEDETLYLPDPPRLRRGQTERSIA